MSFIIEELNVTGQSEAGPSNHGTKVTLNLPAAAVDKLSQLLAAGDHVLRDLGIASLQLEEGQVCCRDRSVTLSLKYFSNSMVEIFYTL